MHQRILATRNFTRRITGVTDNHISRVNIAILPKESSIEERITT